MSSPDGQQKILEGLVTSTEEKAKWQVTPGLLHAGLGCLSTERWPSSRHSPLESATHGRGQREEPGCLSLCFVTSDSWEIWPSPAIHPRD